MKLTEKRKEILGIIYSSKVPLNAKNLKHKVNFDLSTIYRALDFLEKNKYIYSLDFENEKYYFKDENAHFFICSSCRHMEFLPGFSSIETEARLLRKKGFSLISHLSIFKGKCNDCND